MRNKILVCISNSHTLYNDNFKRHGVKVGVAYKCVDELILTSDKFYKPEFASLNGVTIRSGVGRWGWNKPCLPKECFRVATIEEVKKYNRILKIKMPFFWCKIHFFKMIHKIDYVLRRRYYKKLEEYFL